MKHFYCDLHWQREAALHSELWICTSSKDLLSLTITAFVFKIACTLKVLETLLVTHVSGAVVFKKSRVKQLPKTLSFRKWGWHAHRPALSSWSVLDLILRIKFRCKTDTPRNTEPANFHYLRRSHFHHWNTTHHPMSDNNCSSKTYSWINIFCFSWNNIPAQKHSPNLFHTTNPNLCLQSEGNERWMTLM